MKQPVRAEISLVFADQGNRGTRRVLELRRVLEEHGMIFESALIERMDPGDVIPGSLLAQQLDG